MKKENFKKDQFMHDPKKIKNEKNAKSQSKHDDEVENDEEATFDETLKKGSRHEAGSSMPANPSPS